MISLFRRAWRMWSRHRNYAACLRCIEHLERELFPEWFVETETFSFESGARWVVSDPNYVQILLDPYDWRNMKIAELHQRNLVHSALLAVTG